ncbi:hypothetical protein GJW-30_1_02085 [Variibacter gotjawalensis]|uniref:Uncharacterized protein n=1 Tax=Variibacter gotjawalensis TaxID=1333996 RepID=A0A0S3PUQ5_9BRAD|nr:hypothetical protein [Variibacter gotjawalensis]RZS45877.1 hypothetical protein EV661_4203 [Variibacter gotjawalensis]BAT59552.1 hypothetical protein GJW-30_1_02085 [Variibacter gotjawalensis]
MQEEPNSFHRHTKLFAAFVVLAIVAWAMWNLILA